MLPKLNVSIDLPYILVNMYRRANKRYSILIYSILIHLAKS
jgi:hypothetical protein